MTLADEKERFLRDWFDYVNDLSGPISARKAWEYYLEERAHVVSSIKGQQIFRHVLSAPDRVAAVGQVSDVGRFWTLSPQVAAQWRPGGSYSETHPLLEHPDAEPVVYQANVALDDVDIVETVACRLGSSWEDEIRLLPGRAVRIEAVEHIPLDQNAPSL